MNPHPPRKCSPHVCRLLPAIFLAALLFSTTAWSATPARYRLVKIADDTGNLKKCVMTVRQPNVNVPRQPRFDQREIESRQAGDHGAGHIGQGDDEMGDEQQAAIWTLLKYFKARGL